MPSSSTPSTIGTSAGDTPPTHRINLSLAPRSRYASLATEYAPRLRSITSIFDTLVLEIFPESYLRWIKAIARVFLRRVYDDEETEEIRGIAEATGIEVYLVVCLNVLLDLLMGCTSGAALHRPAPGEADSDALEGGAGARMLHFRTLDWDMPALRQLLVTLEFVESDETEAPVLARNITYVGFVGVLTGVRPGLSVSLNFRPNHDDGTWVKNFKYYGRHLLVLLGFKRSISSILRQTIIPARPGKPSWLPSLISYLLIWKYFGRTRQPINTLSLEPTVSHILATPSTACYLILSDGRESYVLEKDYKTTTVESSSSFIVATNNDRSVTAPPTTEHSSRQEHTGASLMTAGDPVLLVDFIKDSIERRACMQAHWDMKVASARQAVRRASQGSNISSSSQARSDPLRRTRSSRSQASRQNQETVPASAMAPVAQPEVTASLEELVTWTSRYPTTNEMTHFATVLDPVKGTIAWIKRYIEPLECSWELTDFE
ncbi:beta subunit of N-acylethanolamine-hydrolyzing acid amidase-domain-containing protein [Aspergillus heterothallicus]